MCAMELHRENEKATQVQPLLKKLGSADAFGRLRGWEAKRQEPESLLSKNTKNP